MTPMPMKKVVFIMGSSATGKSKLSIDIASQLPTEIINSDKIQVYKGLDIITNKLPEVEGNSVPHHLLGVIDNPDADFTPSQFQAQTLDIISAITSRGNTALVVGGSNSCLEALVDDAFLASFSCLFIWLDAHIPVLFDYMDERVDQMVKEGVVEEVRGFLKPGADLSRGIWRAIGVPELAKCFWAEEEDKEEEECNIAMAIAETKSNTRRLVSSQRDKILRLRDEAGWDIWRLDVTKVLECRTESAVKEAAWKKHVLLPCLEIVKAFQQKEGNRN